VRPAVAAGKAKRESKTEKTSWEGVDRALFEVLRKLRREIADEREIPAWMVFSDASLRDMARLRPQTADEFLEVHGVGQKKSAECSAPPSWPPSATTKASGGRQPPDASKALQSSDKWRSDFQVRPPSALPSEYPCRVPT
jgi:hypothetical protein